MSSWSSQTWSLQTRKGRRPRCHSKPLSERGKDKRQAGFRGGWHRTARYSAADGDLTLSPFHSPVLTGQPQTARAETSLPSGKFIRWSCEKKLAREEKKRRERSFSVPSGEPAGCGSLVTHLIHHRQHWVVITLSTTVRTRLLPPTKAN